MRGKTKDVKIFLASDNDTSPPRIFAIPQEFRFPIFFIDFPLLKSGIRHLVEGKEKRYSDNGKVRAVVKKPLSPASMKLLMLLMAQKEQQVYMKVRDVMRVIGYESNAPRDSDKYISNIQEARISITFSEEIPIPEMLKPFFSSVRLKSGEYKKRIRDIIIISSVSELLRAERKVRYTKVNFSQEFVSLCSSSKGYVKVKTDILKQLTNKHSEELLLYLLCLKMQKKHLKDYLTLYLLNCSQKFLVEKVEGKKVDTVIRTIRRIFERSLKSLQKLKELNVIEDFSYEEGRLRIGDGGRTVPFFETLTIVKNPQ